MRKHLLVAMASALMMSVALPPVINAASNGNAQAREAFAEAVDFRNNGDVRSARIKLLNAIKNDPEWIDARVMQAEVLLTLFDGIGAQAELDRAMQLGLDPAAIRHLYGHALELQGDWPRARAELTSDDIPPQHQAYAARILGRVGMQTGDDLLASQAFDRAITLDASSPELWVDIARFRASSGDQGGAIAAVDEAVKLDVNNIRALQYRGEMLRSQYGLAAALPWFERGLQLDPNDVALLTEYAATLGDMGRMSDMLVVARKIISLDGNNPRAYFMQAVLAARAGRYDLARALLQKMNGRMDDVPAVLMVQGIIDHGERNYNAAIDKFRKLASIQPENQQVQTLLGRSLYLAGDEEEAVAVLKPQVNRSGAEPYALWQAGRALEAMGLPEEAAGVLNRAAVHDVGDKSGFEPEVPIGVLAAEASRSPNDARAVIPYIRALFNDGNFNAAFAEAKRLQQRNPGASDAHILVADTAFSRGDYAEALNALNLARQIRFTEPVMLRLVEVLRAKGDMQQAGEILAQYLTYNPTSVAGLRWMAYAHLETGNWQVAATILENLRKRIGDNDALLMAGLAQAYTGLGETDKAVAAGRVAYYVQPSSPVVSHLYGLALLAKGERDKDATDLIEKAVTISPNIPLYRQSLAKAKRAMSQKS